MKRILSLILLAVVGFAASAQTITLSFIGKDTKNKTVMLDQITVKNVTRGWTETLTSPDTILTMPILTGIDDAVMAHGLGQAMPNPFNGTTDVMLNVQESQPVAISVYDMMGKEIMFQQQQLNQGAYALHISLETPATYILNVKMKNYNNSVKLVNTGHAGANNIALAGINRGEFRGTTNNPFAIGDKLKITGYTLFGDQEIAGILEVSPTESSLITIPFNINTDMNPEFYTYPAFQISDTGCYSGFWLKDGHGKKVNEYGVCWDTKSAPTYASPHNVVNMVLDGGTTRITNLTPNTTYYLRAYAITNTDTIYAQAFSFKTNDADTHAEACPGVETVTDFDGNVYTTVKIGTQCWMQQNLRVLHYSDSTEIPMSSGDKDSYTEPYCYYPAGNKDYAELYGIYYNYVAMMRAVEPDSSQGICPDGWHVATDQDWTTLTDYVLAQSDYNFDKYFLSTTGLNLTPSAYYYEKYRSMGYMMMMWASTSYNETSAWQRMFGTDTKNIYRYGFKKCAAMSARCIQD